MGLEQDGRVTHDFIEDMSGKYDDKEMFNILVNDVSKFEANVRRALRIKEETEFINRYDWSGLPLGMTQELLERILYYRGQAVGFMLEGEFMFLPFALDAMNDSGIDAYGRYKYVRPFSFNGTSYYEKTEGGKKEVRYKDGLLFDSLLLRVANRNQFSMEKALEDPETSCVLLYDYPKQLSQHIVPRSVVNGFLHEELSNILCMVHKNVVKSGVMWTIVVDTEAKKRAIEIELSGLEKSLIQKYAVVLTSHTEFQELATPEPNNIPMLFEAYSSIDNLRKLFLGMENQGVFEKKQQMLQVETEQTGQTTSMVYNDGLRQRQEFCVYMNALFGTMMWVEGAAEDQGADGDMNPNKGDTQDTYDNEGGE